MSRKVLADIQILDADDNYDGTASESAGDPTDYRRFRYNDDSEGEYLWKDPLVAQHSNIDYSDPGYLPDYGGPVTRTISDVDSSVSQYEIDSTGKGGLFPAPSNEVTDGQ